MIATTRLSVAGVCALLFVAGCASTPDEHPKLKHLGSHHLPVSTQSAAAQQAFDRGLTLAYSFAYYAAEQEFRRAAALDPNCAMAWWGVALVNGPHINFPMVPPEKAKVASESMRKARDLSRGSTPLEQALIAALDKRYRDPQPEDRLPLDEAYADAMRKVWADHPQSADAATLYAESVMDLHPWNYWNEQGAQPWTMEILDTLERAMKLNPNHPGANHYYIHAVEASKHPERAVAAADRLGGLVPDLGHMVHMPSHIYARIGRWQDAAECNRKAMRADVQYRAAYPRPGFYGLYMAHNGHFLGFVAMMDGRSEEAIRCARETVNGVPPDFKAEFPGVVDGFMVFVPEALMRFGRWEEILKEPQPAESFHLARALWRFTRASALTALNRPEEARAEQALFEKAASEIPPDRTMGNNHATNIVAIARDMLAGEMAASAGDLDTAVDHLRKAVRVEDTLVYDEPPGWLQPVRHTLGAVLLKAGKAAEAETVYREELKRNPENGWSLMGMRDALQMQGNVSDAAAFQARFKTAWADADVTPPSTCYCQKLSKL